MTEEIKKEFEKRFCKHNQISPYDWNHWEADYNVPIDVSAKMVWQFIEQKLTEAIKQAKVEENERFKTNFVKAIESAQDHGNILFNELNKYKGFNDWVGKNNKYDADKVELRRFIISCFKLFASEIKCKILEPESTN